jgi:hypothetical protein
MRIRYHGNSRIRHHVNALKAEALIMGSGYLDRLAERLVEGTYSEVL